MLARARLQDVLTEAEAFVPLLIDHHTQLLLAYPRDVSDENAERGVLGVPQIQVPPEEG